MNNPYSYKLTEEIARWAFEIKIEENSDWFIAFTNPTAGPWKRVTASNDKGEIGEVYRFSRRETRPDILLYNDKYEVILIIEAKDSLSKLIKDSQIEKSANVVLNLSNILKNKVENQFWKQRINYTVIAGLLWGAEEKSTKQERYEAFTLYESYLSNNEDLCSPIMVGIESLVNKKGEINCLGYLSHPGNFYKGLTGTNLLESLAVLY